MEATGIAERAGAIGAASPLGRLRAVAAVAATRRRRAAAPRLLCIRAKAAVTVVGPVVVRRRLAEREAVLLRQTGGGGVVVVVVGGGLLRGDEFADAEQLVQLEAGLAGHLVEVGDVGQAVRSGAGPLLGGVELLAELVGEVGKDVAVLGDLRKVRINIVMLIRNRSRGLQTSLRAISTC